VVEPWSTLCEDGLTEREKSGVDGAVTTSVADVVRVREPLTPVIVSGYVPAAVLAVVAIVKLELAPDAGFGL
jgi:hypothetical protein